MFEVVKFGNENVTFLSCGVSIRADGRGAMVESTADNKGLAVMSSICTLFTILFAYESRMKLLGLLVEKPRWLSESSSTKTRPAVRHRAALII